MNRLRSESGFSLIEVLAAVVLLSIIAVGLSAATIGGIRSNTTSRQITAATSLVHDKMEEFRSLNLARDFTPGLDPADLVPGTHIDPGNPLSPLGFGGGQFIRSWVITGDVPNLHLSKVEVTVTWEGPGVTSFTGVTYVCRTNTCR